MDFSITFLKILYWGIFMIAPVLGLLGSTIIVLGLIVGRLESWSRFESIYWAFITALTVGYGDIRPQKKLARALSALIAIIGIMFAGIIVAITVEATSRAFEQNVSPDIINDIQLRLPSNESS